MLHRNNIGKLTGVDSLKFSTFNYFGLGAVLPAVSEAYWINFSAYYLNSILADQGNLIFLLAQIVEGFGVLLSWFLLVKFRGNQMLPVLLYIIGTTLLIFSLPIVFLPPLANFPIILVFSCLHKIGNGLMIISHLTIIPKITTNRNRRRKLVQKITQFGFAGTFLAMSLITAFSEYFSFSWKYFVGISIFMIIGSLCSIAYVYKIRELINQQQAYKKSEKQIPYKQQQPNNIFMKVKFFKQIRFYSNGIILLLTSLYFDIIMSMYPYFIKSFHHISQFKYLAAIVVLFLAALVSSIFMKNTFVYTGIRTVMSLGLICSLLSTIFFIFGLISIQFGVLIFIGTALTGISKVIAMNTILNLINQHIGRQVQGKQFVYSFYYFIEKITTGVILFLLLNQVSADNSSGQNLLHFSYIYLPFILYCCSWLLVMIDRTYKHYTHKKVTIMIQPQHKTKFTAGVYHENSKDQQHGLPSSKVNKNNIKYDNVDILKQIINCDGD